MLDACASSDEICLVLILKIAREFLDSHVFWARMRSLAKDFKPFKSTSVCHGWQSRLGQQLLAGPVYR